MRVFCHNLPKNKSGLSQLGQHKLIIKFNVIDGNDNIIWQLMSTKRVWGQGQGWNLWTMHSGLHMLSTGHVSPPPPAGRTCTATRWLLSPFAQIDFAALNSTALVDELCNLVALDHHAVYLVNLQKQLHGKNEEIKRVPWQQSLVCPGSVSLSQSCCRG